MEEVVSDSALPWSWVVEALAKSQLVDASLLNELLSKVPPLLGNSGKQAKEAAALRCLEEHFGPNLSSENHEVCDESKVRFDTAESCETALRHMTSCFEGASNELKWDIRSFINHKKASLPRSTLELLKDTISEGTHPIVASLKQNLERDFSDQCFLKIPLNDNQCPPAKKRKMNSECGIQSKQQHSVAVGSNQICKDTEDGHHHEVINYEVNKKTFEKDDEQTKTYVENHDQQSISPNIGDCCHEEIDLEMKSPNFLSSLSAFTRDFLAMTEAQPNICMKCNKDGQLLSCSGSCSLMFHESCLGCSASFDDQGKFYCPFCAYSHAISEYVRAKEKVFSTRKELSRFIGGRTLDQPQHNGNTSSGGNVNQDRHMNADQTTKVKEGANNATQVTDPYQSNLKDRKGAEIVTHHLRGPEGIWNYRQDDRCCDGATFSGNIEQFLDGTLKFLELKRKNDTRCKIAKLRVDASHESICNLDELTQDERNCRTISLLSPIPLSAIPARRKKVPWTAEEEDMLMKAVNIFAKGDDRVVPWKVILQCGGSVFQPGRTAVDLKDKWRNLSRKMAAKQT
ncbi:uncharacterized protein LOC130823384 isoform X2 [Amaranthus tricolor]|uniref:uncharacterized protein LOC130823384 isoform X2 n=1 Tax=Amaranthus tricolor TaxID=29722 RepID=UPI0025834B53|nr:uncharacterized protein LOC130823384 isoform X2 [Amaranthus tricolor]